MLLAAAGYSLSGAVVCVGLAVFCFVPVYLIRRWIHAGRYSPERLPHARRNMVVFTVIGGACLVVAAWNVVQSVRP